MALKFSSSPSIKLKFGPPAVIGLNPDPLDLPAGAEKVGRSFTRKAKSGSQRMPLFATAMAGVTLVSAGCFLVLYFGLANLKAAVRDQAASPQNSTLGKIVVTDGDNCRKLEFDNMTGSVKDADRVSCDAQRLNGSSAAGPQYQYPTNRLDSVRRGFSK